MVNVIGLIVVGYLAMVGLFLAGFYLGKILGAKHTIREIKVPEILVIPYGRPNPVSGRVRHPVQRH